MAEVYLNGKSLGILWKPPFRVDNTHAAKPGKNQLVIEVANTWSNRFVGDGYLTSGIRLTLSCPLDCDKKTKPTFTKWRHYPKIGRKIISPPLKGAGLFDKTINKLLPLIHFITGRKFRQLPNVLQRMQRGCCFRPLLCLCRMFP